LEEGCCRERGRGVPIGEDQGSSPLYIIVSIFYNIVDDVKGSAQVVVIPLLLLIDISKLGTGSEFKLRSRVVLVPT